MQETPVQFLGREDPLEKGYATLAFMGFPGGSAVKHPPAMRETWVRSLGWEDPLEEGMTTNSSILAWRVPVDRGAWWGHKKSDMTERLSTFDDNKV